MRKKDPDLMKRILEYVTEYYLNYSSTPSTTQIANEVGVARGTAYKYLVAMNESGMLKYQDGDIVTASMEKIVTDREDVSALGKIACGEPALEEENILFKTSLPTAMFGKGPFYILYAKGDSMVDAGIEEGDIIVALDENNENTLKCYGGIDETTGKARLEYQNKAVYGDKVILVNQLICQGVLSHIIKER